MNKLNKFLKIILPIVGVAGFGSLFVVTNIDWFNNLIKPSQWIASFVIPIMWTIIYTLFAIILWHWLDKEKLSKPTIILLIINGALNVLWCLLFFMLRLTFVGLLTIIINLIFAIVLWKNINKQERLYSYILSIYPIWLCFATALNCAIWILN